MTCSFFSDTLYCYHKLLERIRIFSFKIEEHDQDQSVKTARGSQPGAA